VVSVSLVSNASPTMLNILESRFSPKGLCRVLSSGTYCFHIQNLTASQASNQQKADGIHRNWFQIQACKGVQKSCVKSSRDIRYMAALKRALCRWRT
jgi:hypothetical protein